MKGILFKPDMIKAIVEGCKTQTRRAIKPQPLESYLPDSDFIKLLISIPKRTIRFHDKHDSNFIHVIPAPRYQVGEVVYIKEAFCQVCYEKDGIEDVCLRYDNGEETKCADAKWRSPLFMPAWAACYFIKITDVRAERLADMKEEDAIAEGIEKLDPFCGSNMSFNVAYDGGKFLYGSPIGAYEELWNSINKPPYDWQSNCWVWVYEFKFLPSITLEGE